MKLTLEQKKEKVKDLRPIDDVFFEVLASQKGVCEEILRTIMQDSNLIVKKVYVQNSIRNLYGRSVRLDALCTLGDGKKVNIEVQKSDNDDHLRRAWFNASSIVVKESQKGTEFKDIPDLYIIYISFFDFLKGNKTLYHIDKITRETGQVVNDGLYEIFVNTTVNDGTDIADLMQCFLKTKVENPKFPILSEKVTELKETTGGLTNMCSIMQKYEDIAREEGLKQGIDKGLKQGLDQGLKKGEETKAVQMATNLIRLGKITLEEISMCSGLSLERVKSLAKN